MEILADKLRPNKLSDILGQEHLVGRDKVIYNLIKNKHPISLILYGSPGTGKTSIANVIASELSMHTRFLNATVNNKKDFDIAIEEAKMYGELILVVDEIHRMNKDKQDLFLPYLENGLIILIGLTTSNPYYSINPAIRSRVEIFELHNLTKDDIKKGLKNALKYLDGIKIDNDALDTIVSLSSGDIRSAYNLLEMLYYGSKDKKITKKLIEEINPKAVFVQEKNSNTYYEVISAFQKSIRGSDPDAAIFYLARLLEVGDLDIIYRRLSVIAYEDIGLANPGIGPKLEAAISAAERTGLPEARIPLAKIVIEMSLSPKSNSSIKAIDKALNILEDGQNFKVPGHINSENNPLYKYPHNYPNSWVKQDYLPDDLKDQKFYIPCKNKYELNLVKIDKERKDE